MGVCRRAALGGLAAALLGGSAPAAAAGELVVVTGRWCPYECEPDEFGGMRGYLNDIVLAVLGESGVQLNFVSTPFVRGMQMLREKQGDVLVGITPEEVPELVYPELEQGVNVYTFFVRAQNSWQYAGPDSFEQLRKLGLAQGEDYGELNDAIARNPARVELMTGLDRTRRNLGKLLAGRLDAIIADPAVVALELRRMKEGSEQRVRAAGSLRSTYVYVAFAPHLPEARHYAELLSRGTQRLRESGALAQILARYGLRDWRSPQGEPLHRGEP